MRSYDPRCYDLAEHFMQQQPLKLQTVRNTHALADAIQTAIEQFLEGLKQ